MEHLTLYVNPTWRRPGIHTPLLNPWWGNPNPEESLFAKEMFDAYQFDVSVYTITDDITKADLVLVPYKYQWFLRNTMFLFEECIQTAQQARLPLLIDGVGDIDHTINISNAYVLRIGGYRFVPEQGRIQIPPPSDDLLERCCKGQLQIRKKGVGRPVVGFAGWAKLTLVQHLRTMVKEIPIRLRGICNSRYRAMQKGVLWRIRALAVLKRSPLVILNLKERASFSGSAKTAVADMRRLRQELADTVLESDYCLDVRGDANDSTRLFEVLSLGRIPVLLDTERRLPFSDMLDYKEFCLTVDFRDIKKLPERIAEFHNTISPERFEAMQRRAREVFVQYFRIDAQMRQIVRELSKML
jgi:glycosyltransferase involved in cell wall biosynthesis